MKTTCQKCGATFHFYGQCPDICGKCKRPQQDIEDAERGRRNIAANAEIRDYGHINSEGCD